MAEFLGRIGHLDGIESPWGNAGGVVKTTEDVLKMAQTGVGWIEDGSHVLGGERLGNEWNPKTLQFDRRVYYHDPKKGETTNSLDMPGMGFDALEPEIHERVGIAHAHGKKYILNVAPVSDKPVAEVVELASRGYAAGADAVLVNAGCPNIMTKDGGRRELLSRSPAGMIDVFLGLYEANLPKPVMARVSPQEDYSLASIIYNTLRASGVVSAVFVPNAWPDYIPLDDDGTPILQVEGAGGGRSGPAMKILARMETRWAVSALMGSRLDVVSSSSIMAAKELKKRLMLGAVAGAGTTFYYESMKGWKEDTDKMLWELAS